MSRTAPDPSAPIVCRITTWYYRRMGLLAAMFLGMGLYFFYDGRIGYPKSNLQAMEKARFEQEIIEGPEGYEAAAARGEDAKQEWMREARLKGWIVNPKVTEPSWKDYASLRGWAENPRLYTVEEINQQFYLGAAMIVGAVVTGILVLLNHTKVLTGHIDHMVMPNGVSVRYADAICVDKRKWDNKGLAYIHYRETEGASTHRVTMDDLKFGGVEKVLERLLSQFKGELIEKVPDEEDEEEQTATEAANGGTLPPKA